ncbi:MAG: HpsJ family protein [Calothrix sp. MO_167.B12]|nr:HpsJ family protein [Calothrix sp. MO_167.B12]
MIQLDKYYSHSSNSVFRLVGYVLLTLAFVDFVNILLPFKFTNPVWEFQMIGALVEHAPVPLIGLMFVFVGERNNRNQAEIHFLKFLSWAALVVGILFLLLLPLGLKNTWRIDSKNNQQIISQSAQKLSPIQELKKQLNNAQTNQEINTIFKSLNQQGNTPKLNNSQQIKSEVIAKITQIENKVTSQLKQVRSNTRRELLRKSIKWNVGAIICAFAFIWIWRATDWARLPSFFNL